MRKKREAYHPNAGVLDTIKKAKANIYPDVDTMKDWYANYANNHQNRLAFDLQYLLDAFPNPAETQVLELGSVPPILNLAIKESGFNITGFDIDPTRFQGCIKDNSLNVKAGIIGPKLDFPDNQFDAIIMNEVFEHLNTNLIGVIEEIKRILKPGGKLFISTPNLKSMVGIKNFLLHGKAYSCCGEIYEEYHKIQKFGHMGHVREYTPAEVILFLTKLNMTVDTLIYRGKYPMKYRPIEALFPRLKPFFSVVAIKN